MSELLISFLRLPHKSLLPLPWGMWSFAQQLNSVLYIRLAVDSPKILTFEMYWEAHLQYAVIDTAVIQISSAFHSGKGNIGGNNYGLARKPPTIDHIENTLLAEAGVSLFAEIIQDKKIGTHQVFQIIVTVISEIALHTVDYIGHRHEKHRDHTLNQRVCNAPDSVGFPSADIPEQQKPDAVLVELVPIFGVGTGFGKLVGHGGGIIKSPRCSGYVVERLRAQQGYTAQSLKVASPGILPFLFLSGAFAENGMPSQTTETGMLWEKRLLRRMALAAVFQPIIGIDIIVRCTLYGTGVIKECG